MSDDVMTDGDGHDDDGDGSDGDTLHPSLLCVVAAPMC